MRTPGQMYVRLTNLMNRASCDSFVLEPHADTGVSLSWAGDRFQPGSQMLHVEGPGLYEFDHPNVN